MHKLSFSKLVEINPHVKIEKGKEYPFVEMGVIDPGGRYVRAGQKRIFQGGGAKFLTGDTLFARITPCLENGKIAQYQAAPGRAGFGSTEFFVFRARPEISDSGFVYYLSKSDLIRKTAEKSMSGASGRQRADLKSMVDLEVPFPDLATQRKIAAILSAYDDLMDNNLQRIKILEEMAQSFYSEWFVKFRFPGHEQVRFTDSPLGQIPEGWETGKLTKIVNICSGFAFKSSQFIDDAKYKIITIKNVKDAVFLAESDSQIEQVPKNMPEHCFLYTGDILLSLTGNVGRVCLVYGNNFLLNQRVAKLVPRVATNRSFIYCMFRQKDLQTKLEMLSTGVAQQNLSPILMGEMEISIPPETIFDKFSSFCEPIYEQIISLYLKNGNLSRTRELLLPKLISGEVDVSELDITVPKEAV